MPTRPRLARSIALAITLCLALLAGARSTFAQAFQAVDEAPAEIRALPEFVRPSVGHLFRIDWPALDVELAAAALANPDPAGDPGADLAPLAAQRVISLPSPSGQTQRYRIVESAIMEPGLAAQFPSFKTYKVRGVDDPIAVGRLDITSHGLRGFIRTAEGSIFIDPWSARQREFVSAYFLHDFGGRDNQWTCGVPPQPPLPIPDDDAGANLGPGVPLRSFRMAMACTGEYGAYQSTIQGRAPNATDALAAIVTVVNRCNVTFEADLGVRFILIANNNLIAFFDPALDPYPDSDPNCTVNPAADCSGGYLSANITALDSIIGSANFDIGHVLTRVRGGVAYLAAVCGGNKAGGSSGIPRGGEVEPASALVPMHEIGHQFGANHTFNGIFGRCAGNINTTTSWEPGGGSTLMAYPGACAVGGPIGEGDTDNLVLFADPYFHTGSLLEMRGFLATSQSRCSANVAAANAGLPVFTALPPSGVVIPPSTPFRLAAAATDDAPALAYCWDELDAGPPQRLVGPTSGDNGTSPRFRSFPPVASGARTFPRLSDVLAGTSYIGERPLTLANSMRKFRVTVRDNQGASTSSSTVSITVAGSAPFGVLEPVSGQAARPPSLLVRWNGSAIAPLPIGTQSVTIALSIDGGQTFAFNLGSFPAAAGQASVAITSAMASARARVRVAADANVFFNVSPTFVILPPCGPVDFNGSGNLDPDDLADYIACYFSTAPPCSRADFNADEVVDPDDLSDFISAFFGGC